VVENRVNVGQDLVVENRVDIGQDLVLCRMINPH
jgi:hypothetical protein